MGIKCEIWDEERLTSALVLRGARTDWDTTSLQRDALDRISRHSAIVAAPLKSDLCIQTTYSNQYRERVQYSLV